MIGAPKVGDRVLITGVTQPPICATVEGVVGFQQRNDGPEWVVDVNVDSQPGVGPTAADTQAGEFQVNVVPLRYVDTASWQLVDPQRPQPTSKHDSRLEEASRLAAQLVDVVRWALGENGEFVDAPENVASALVVGRRTLKLKGHETPLYWWRGELRRRAKEAGANL